jgi:DNA-binding transcriptional ArsR family regulator
MCALNLEEAPLTRAAFGPATPPEAARGPRPIEQEWMKIAEHEQDVIVYWGGTWNRRDVQLGWGWCSWHVRGDKSSEGRPHPAVGAPASSVERLMSPLAHEARIRIMQAMYDGPKSSGVLSQATGMTGGNLYYHLKELIHAAYVCEKDGAYDLTPLGCQMLVTVAMIAHEIVKDRGEEGLLVAATWERSEASLKPLRYSVSEGY